MKAGMPLAPEALELFKIHKGPWGPLDENHRDLLAPAAQKLRAAAAVTGNRSLRSYLTKRADALLSDDYFASDVAWMDLDRASRLLDRYGKSTPDIATMVSRLQDIPVDIAPVSSRPGKHCPPADPPRKGSGSRNRR